MIPYEIDEEKALGGFVSTTGSPASPSSPQFSRVNTAAEYPRPIQRTDSTWSRRVNSLRSVVGLTKPSRSNSIPREDETSEDEADDDDNNSKDANPSIIRKIHEQARGYPKLAAFLDADENFMVYRRFGYLQSRLLLDKQAQLAKLEFDLDEMEHREAKDDPECKSLQSRRKTAPEKKALLHKIEVTFNAYCQLVSNASAMTALHKPTDDEYVSVDNWLRNVKPVVPSEARFIRCREDLVILRPGREHAWLDSGVEKLLRWIGWAPVRRLFQSRDTRQKSNGTDGTLLFSRGRINNFVLGLITLMILALLVVPIYILLLIANKGETTGAVGVRSIGVLLVATLAFSACISLFTKARRHEILAASAAYCAVLVVFIGNLGQNIAQHLGSGSR